MANDDVFELAENKRCERQFTQLFGEEPADKTKIKEWKAQRLAWFLSWSSSNKSTLHDIAVYYGLIGSVWSMCEDCESTKDGYKLRPNSGGYNCEIGSPIYPDDGEVVTIPFGGLHDHLCSCNREYVMGTNLCSVCDREELSGIYTEFG